MPIPYPFLTEAYVDICGSLAIREGGPNSEEMEVYQTDFEAGRLYKNLRFETSRGTEEVYVTDMRPDRQVPNAWWIAGEIADGTGDRVGVYFRPDCLSKSFMVCERDLIYD